MNHLVVRAPVAAEGQSAVPAPWQHSHHWVGDVLLWSDRFCLAARNLIPLRHIRGPAAMTRRYELTDEGFALIVDLLPPTGEPGGRWNDHCSTLNGIFWVLHTGAQWREVPDRYGRWGTVYGRLRAWRADGTIDSILERLHLELNERGLIDDDLWCVDATSIRAGRAAAGAVRSPKKSRRRAGRPRPGPLARRGSARSSTW